MFTEGRRVTASALLTVATGAVGTVGCGDAPRASGCDPLVEGATIVASAGAGVWEREGRVPVLAELWRRGGTNEGEELAFPIFPAASPSGRLAIPDFQLAEVTVVEPDGTWLGPWARQGSGPGEIATPVAVAWASDGTLAVFDIANSSVVHLKDGEPVGEDVRIDPTFVAPILSAGQLAWAGVHPDGTVLLDPGWSSADPSDETARGSLIVRLTPGAAAPDTVARSTIPIARTEALLRTQGVREWPVPGWPRPVAATGADGALAWGGADSTYRILIERVGAAGPLQICRHVPPLPLTAAERGDSVREGLEALADAIRAAAPPAVPASFGRLVLGATGRVWVQRERPEPLPSGAGFLGRPGARHDVFDADGEYLGEVRMPPRATLHAARGDTIWVFETGEYDETWVVAYRLELRSEDGGATRGAGR